MSDQSSQDKAQTVSQPQPQVASIAGTSVTVAPVPMSTAAIVAEAAPKAMGEANALIRILGGLTPNGLIQATLGILVIAQILLIVLLVGALGLTQRYSAQMFDSFRADQLRETTDTNTRMTQAMERMWKDREASEEKTRMILDRVLEAFRSNTQTLGQVQTTQSAIQDEIRALRETIKMLARSVGKQELIPIAPSPKPIALQSDRATATSAQSPYSPLQSHRSCTSLHG